MRLALPLLRPLVAFALPLGFAACVAAVSPARRDGAPATAGPLLWVSNEGSGDVALVDAGRGEVVARVPVGPRPRGLRIDRARGLLHAADGPANAVVVLDGTSLTVIRRIPVGTLPWGVAMVP